MSTDRCPACGGGQGLLRVEHTIRSNGVTYDRFFCPACGATVEMNGFSPAAEAVGGAEALGPG